MKLIGIVLINIASVITGISMAQKLKNKYVICCELLEMCNLMSIEIGYYSNDTKSVVNHLSNEPGLSHLKFLKTYNPENINIKTELTDSENEKINALFKILGTTDSDSMLYVINSFSKSIEESKEKYLGSFKSHSRLYIAFGVFGGMAVSILLV